MEDAELVSRCLAGDADAVRALIGRFEGEVFGLCLRLLRHRQDAEDVTQEAFVRVFRSLHRWEPERPLRPWIVGIAVNRCRTLMGQRARRPELADYLHETPARTADDDSRELARELAAALDGIRPDFRAVFVLFHEHGRSYEDIAQTLGRPVGTVKTWLHRARAELLAALRERGMVDALADPAARRPDA